MILPTTLLGALVTFGVMVHVAALNFCYDVPVKLFSSHLVLMSLFLMAPDLPWLTRVFLLGRPAAPRGYTPLVGRPGLDWILFVVRTLVVLTFLGVKFYDNYARSKLHGRQVPEPPLFGLWEVEEFALDGKVRLPLTTDAGRWQRVSFGKPFTFRKSNPGKPGDPPRRPAGRHDPADRPRTAVQRGGAGGDRGGGGGGVPRGREVRPEAGEGPAAAQAALMESGRLWDGFRGREGTAGPGKAAPGACPARRTCLGRSGGR